MSELIGDYGEVTDLALLGSCDSTYLAVASNSPSVRIFELASGKLLESLIEHQDIVLCLSVSSDISTRSLILLSGSKDGFVALWNVQVCSSMGNHCCPKKIQRPCVQPILSNLWCSRCQVLIVKTRALGILPLNVKHASRPICLLLQLLHWVKRRTAD